MIKTGSRFLGGFLFDPDRAEFEPLIPSNQKDLAAIRTIPAIRSFQIGSLCL